MAVVMELKVNNATVRFHDDAYAGCSAEEIERRKKQARMRCGGAQRKRRRHRIRTTDEGITKERRAIMYEMTNGACLGYTILAMERLGCDLDEIMQVVEMMRYSFDSTSCDDADDYYRNSNY